MEGTQVQRAIGLVMAWKLEEGNESARVFKGVLEVLTFGGGEFIRVITVDVGGEGHVRCDNIEEALRGARRAGRNFNVAATEQ